jgi:hypothetical protein
MPAKVLVQITDINQIKLGSVIQQDSCYRKVLKIVDKGYYVSYPTSIKEVDPTPEAINACPILKRIQYLYCKQEFTFPSFNVKRVTFK